MTNRPVDAPPSPPIPPPRAFTQGVGTVFQWIGVSLFLASFFVCCGSALVSRDRATQTNLTNIGWPFYSAQQAITISLVSAVFFGMALAGLGLGLQAQDRRAPWMSVGLTLFAGLFWLFHVVFFTTVSEWGMMLICLVMMALFILLAVFAVAARREMLRTPPPADLEILPADYEVPYSHLHQDPPEVRMARELEQRRKRLAVQQKELEMLEAKLKRRMQQSDE
jgi:lysylphosphatidylglycerol synthetase-like protein (DUF2156 family)